jgi:hypothetical protein
MTKETEAPKAKHFRGVMTNPVVEVLTFEGCPHAQSALGLVERIGRGAWARRNRSEN